MSVMVLDGFRHRVRFLTFVEYRWFVCLFSSLRQAPELIQKKDHRAAHMLEQRLSAELYAERSNTF